MISWVELIIDAQLPLNLQCVYFSLVNIGHFKRLQAIFRTLLIGEGVEYKDTEAVSDAYSVEYQGLVPISFYKSFSAFPSGPS